MATLTYKITENITINGRERGSEITREIASVNEVFYRVVGCVAASDTTVASFKDAVNTSDSALDLQNVKYIRVTNLDDNIDVTLSLQVSIDEDGDADSSTSILLEAGNSFIMGVPHDGISLSDTDANVVTDLNDLESIIVNISGATGVDVEVFIAG